MKINKGKEVGFETVWFGYLKKGLFLRKAIKKMITEEDRNRVGFKMRSTCLG